MQIKLIVNVILKATSFLIVLKSKFKGDDLQQSAQDLLDRDHQTNYMLLMQQRENENRQEIAKLTAEIKSLKVQLLQNRSE